MRRTLIVIATSVVGLYMALYLVVSSSPVQSRLLEELRNALAKVGFELEVESIEFAAFSPKLYLNRVTIRSTSNSEYPLDVPLTIDKIKIQIQPLALLSKKLVIHDALLFNPKILIPRADKLVQKFKKSLAKQERVELEGGTFNIVIRRVGIVDAHFNVVSKDPQIAIKSRSLTVILLSEASSVRTITISTRDLGIERGKLNLVLNEVDVDFDLTADSLRVNKGLILGKDISVKLKGAASLPIRFDPNDKGSVWNAAFDLSLPLGILNQVSELGMPPIEGTVVSKGVASFENGSYRGDGEFAYQKIVIDDYPVESGRFKFGLQDRDIRLSDGRFEYGRGIVSADQMKIRLGDSVSIETQLKVNHMELKGLLVNIDEAEAPVLADVSGTLDVTGTLYPEFKLGADVDVNTKRLAIIDEENSWVMNEQNRIFHINGVHAKGTMNFTTKAMDFQALLETLNGKAYGEGFIGFGKEEGAKIRLRTENTELGALSPISKLNLSGSADVLAEIEVFRGESVISGSMDVRGARIEDVELGDVKGLFHYENALLSFEDLRVPTSLDPVNGSGYVDFRNDTQYRFRAEGKRLETKRLLSVFKNMELPFPAPEEGEISARMLIDGNDEKGFTLESSGSAKGFRWYGEKWVSSEFDIDYNEKETIVKKLLLRKKTGALDVKGDFKDDGPSTLKLESLGLNLDELDYFGTSPISADIEGDIVLSGDLARPNASGSLRLFNTRFREVAVEDSELILNSDNKEVEVYGRLLGEQLRGRWNRNDNKEGRWEALLYFDGFDFTPVLSALMGRDIPTLTEVTATGDLSITGQGIDALTFNGAGTVKKLNLGLKGTPMKNPEELSVKVEKGAFKIERFNLVGRDSQISGEIAFKPGKVFEASVDGKIDLQYLQPFIPGLDYGTGKVSLGLRFSGVPPKINMIGNVILEDGAFRLTGLLDEFRSARVHLTLSQERISIDRFQAIVNGGNLVIEGDVGIGGFQSLRPNLKLTAQKVLFRPQESMEMRVTGDFTIQGETMPYDLKGSCLILGGTLSKLEMESAPVAREAPTFNLDLNCQANDNFMVDTEIMKSEFKGDFHLLGNTNKMGLLGTAEAIRGEVFFRDTQFNLRTATVNFESKTDILPRFNVAGQARVKESTAGPVSQEYDVTLQVIGTPKDYKIRLTSAPGLEENDIISLLVLGVTRSGQTDQSSYVDFGAAVMGEIPLQSKLKRQTGLDIKISNAQPGASAGIAGVDTSGSVSGSSFSGTTVPQVQAQFGISDKTRITYSNTIQANPERGVVVEHELGDNFTVNGKTQTIPRQDTNTQVWQFGVDFRYKFQFE